MRYVAPRVQGKSISDMLNEQLAVVQQQRAANAEARREQQAANRKFRYQQLEDVYNFKLEGWNADAITDFNRMQDEVKNSLNAGQYNFEQFIEAKRDLTTAWNLYNEDAKISNDGYDTYQGILDNPGSFKSDTSEFIGTKENLEFLDDYANNLRFIDVDDRGNGTYITLNGVSVEDQVKSENPGVQYVKQQLEDGSEVLINPLTSEQIVVKGKLINHPHLADRNMFTPPATLIGDITPTEYLYDSKRSGKPGNYYALKVSTEAAVKSLTTDITNAANLGKELDQSVIDERVQNIKINTADKILAKLQQTITVNNNNVLETTDNTNFDSLAYSNAIREWESATGQRWNEDMRKGTLEARENRAPVDIFTADNEELLPEEIWARDAVNSLNIEPKIPKKSSQSNQGQANAQKSFDEILAVTRQEDDNTIPNIVLDGATTRIEQANSDILNGLADMYRLNQANNLQGLLNQVTNTDTKEDIQFRYDEETAKAYPGLSDQINNLGNLGERITVSVPTQNTTFSVMIPGQGGQTGQKNFKSFDYYVGDDMAQGGGDDVLVLHMDQSSNYVWNRTRGDVVAGESGIIIVKESDPEFQDILGSLRGELNKKHGGIVNGQGVLERLIIQKFQ